ncbi:uncharacterized protein LOC134279034 [Saccostrea cucullata]|uniref:uncharacterized protein LOC134279034 n=1 Tax=Saccostrea cuccullata TaxID=36930 RepID=UPI002ED2E254
MKQVKGMVVFIFLISVTCGSFDIKREVARQFKHEDVHNLTLNNIPSYLSFLYTRTIRNSDVIKDLERNLTGIINHRMNLDRNISHIMKEKKLRKGKIRGMIRKEIRKFNNKRTRKKGRRKLKNKSLNA